MSVPINNIYSNLFGILMPFLQSIVLCILGVIESLKKYDVEYGLPPPICTYRTKFHT